MEKYKNIAEFALNTAKELGVDTAHCSVTERETREFNVDGGEFSLFRTLFDRSVAITVFVGGKKGSVSINRFDEDAVRDAVLVIKTDRMRSDRNLHLINKVLGK